MQRNEKKTNRTNRRRLATEKGCRFDLKAELPKLFEAFSKAQQAYETELKQTPPQARARGFEASLLNSKMIQSIQDTFPDYWKFGKYKRFTLRVNGYTVLFKKFDKKGLPMNIQTNSVAAISNQLSLSLFGDSMDVFEPILFFGYQKDKFGVVKDPKLIYIDEERVEWVITADTVSTTKTVTMPKSTEDAPAMPKLKEKPAKKASGQ